MFDSLDPICPACTSTKITETHAVPDREYAVSFVAHYASCLNCGTLRQIPMPTIEQLTSFYPVHYHAQTGRGLLNNLRQSSRLKRLRPFITSEGAVLDFGCGNGAFLLYAAERIPAVKYYGFEHSSERSISNHLSNRVTIVRGGISDLLEVLPSCSLITMNHVIEHLPAPRTTLAYLLEKLLPSGVLEGQTPTAGSLEHRIFREYWSGYHAPRHTVVFSQDGLRQLFEQTGFEGINVSGAFNPAALAVSLASVWQRSTKPGISRDSFSWIGWIGLATVLAPVDLLFGTPGIQNFLARKPSR